MCGHFFELGRSNIPMDSRALRQWGAYQPVKYYFFEQSSHCCTFSITQAHMHVHLLAVSYSGEQVLHVCVVSVRRKQKSRVCGGSSLWFWQSRSCHFYGCELRAGFSMGGEAPFIPKECFSLVHKAKKIDFQLRSSVSAPPRRSGSFTCTRLGKQVCIRLLKMYNLHVCTEMLWYLEQLWTDLETFTM